TNETRQSSSSWPRLTWPDELMGMTEGRSEYRLQATRSTLARRLKAVLRTALRHAEGLWFPRPASPGLFRHVSSGGALGRGPPEGGTTNESPSVQSHQPGSGPCP